ncbi:hypothetical protein DACRYDRAFT_117985 [Dacryopinax primogenitus]|uniref:Uncharacterized protein n=1 Tax=Dacryopinax primogenitus (strain DJM 731) TaxID=1858805 RepID=M5FUQ7_DACPD|nr:uncharacterized protein DACRYDRAFT_117985 [Dacryopinax primogenitus]EJT99219.1 hypothetical protein DACRYDRAFT_117985 [Dacryopinax primogenitus]
MLYATFTQDNVMFYPQYQEATTSGPAKSSTTSPVVSPTKEPLRMTRGDSLLGESGGMNLTKMPYDILTHIFTLANEDDSCLATCSPSPTSRRPSRCGEVAVCLSHVSTQFRDVALSMPTLWRCISVQGRGRSELLRAKCFSSRTQTCPVDIDIDMTVTPKDSQRYICSLRQRYERTDDLRAVMTFLPPMKHWRSFCFTTKSDWNVRLLITVLDQAAPELRTLSLCSLGTSTRTRTTTENATVFNIFQGQTPALSNAFVRGIQLPCVLNVLSKLQELKLSCGTDHTQAHLDECLDVISRNPNLKKLSFCGDVDIHRIDAFTTDPRPPIPLHSLEELAIGGFLPATLSYVLLQLDVPNLTSLTVGKLWRKNYNDALKALTPATCPNIINLSLISCVVHPYLSRFLPQLPAVQGLTFDHWNNPPDAMLLSDDPAQVHPWKDLKRLCLTRPLNINKPLIEALQRRQAMGLGPFELLLEVDDLSLSCLDPMITMQIRELTNLQFTTAGEYEQGNPHEEDPYDMRAW